MIIQTTYKPEECLDHMEEWLQYHTNIGVTKFYLFNNSGGSGNWGNHFYNIPKEYSKKYIKHRYTPKEALELQKPILYKFNVELIEWPNEEIPGVKTEGMAQSLAIAYLINNVIDEGLCAFIDMDEFIIKKEEFKEGRLYSKVYKALDKGQTALNCNYRIKDSILEKYKIDRLGKCILNLNRLPKKISHYQQHILKIYHYELINTHFLSIQGLENCSSYYNHYTMTKPKFVQTMKKKYNDINFTYDEMFEYIEDPFK